MRVHHIRERVLILFSSGSSKFWNSWSKVLELISFVIFFFVYMIEMEFWIREGYGITMLIMLNLTMSIENDVCLSWVKLPVHGKW